MRGVNLSVDADFLIAARNARSNIRSLNIALEELKSDEAVGLVCPETIRAMTDYCRALKDYYNKIYKACVLAIMDLEDDAERNILLCTYLRAMTHADTMRKLGLAKQTYWVKHRSARVHFKAPEGELPAPPKEEDYL